jgi:L-ascorbate metabolism protein UlaG (beta-lactamase superfamily)
VPTAVGERSLFFKVLWALSDQPEGAHAKTKPGTVPDRCPVYENPPASGLRVTWMGHSSMLLEIDGVRVLIDPVWEQRAAPSNGQGQSASSLLLCAWRRCRGSMWCFSRTTTTTILGLTPCARLAQSSSTAGAQWVTTLGVGKILRKLGREASARIGLDREPAGGELELTALPARHFSGRSLFTRFETLWASFVLAGPKHRVYYGADSGEWEGFKEIGQAYGPFDLTMLEIGAFDPLWADIHMGPDGAVRTFRAMGATGLMMPIHWGLFSLCAACLAAADRAGICR